MSQPLTAPAEDAPYEPPHPSDVTVPLAMAAADLVAASQMVYDRIITLINEAAQNFDACARALQEQVRLRAVAATAEYTAAGDRVSSAALSLAGVADLVLPAGIVPAVTADELALRASGMSLPGGGLPPPPSPSPKLPGVIAQQLREQPFKGSHLVVPVTPPMPSALLALTQPTPPYQPVMTGSPPPPAAPPPAPQPPPPAPAGPSAWSYVPFGSSSTAAQSGQLPAAPPPPPQQQVATDGSAKAQPPPAVSVQGVHGQSPVDLLPDVGWGGAPPPRASGDKGDGGPAAGAGPCPPVYVTINCAPGAVATASGGSVQLVAADQGEQPADQVGEDGEGFKQFPVTRSGGAANLPAASQERIDRAAAQGSRNPPTCEIPTLRAVADQWVTAWRAIPTEASGFCEGVGAAQGAIDRAFDATWCWATGTTDGLSIRDGSAMRNYLNELPSLLRMFAEPIQTLLLKVANFLPWMIQITTGCPSRAFPALALIRGAVGALETWVGFPLPEVHRRLDQIINTACPNDLPGIDEANLARMMGTITQQVWECYVKAAGRTAAVEEPIYQASTVRPAPNQVVEARLKLGDGPNELDDWLKLVGVQDRDFRELYRALALYVPGPGDLVTFMTRDVFDPNVVAKYQYDEGFTEKYQGQVKEWAYAQGMTEEVFLNYWRAHWQLPSPTQGYSMIHRLRPGRVAADLVTDRETVRELLEVADVPKYWRDRLVEISYHPLTRTDTRRAYFIGALDERETLDAIMDLGYAEREAHLLLRYWSQERVGWLTRQQLYRDYAAGLVSDDEIEADFDRRQVRLEDRQQITVELGRSATRSSVKARVKSVRKRVLRGLADRAEAVGELTRMGFRDLRAEQLVDVWLDERKAQGRLASAQQLCDWFDNNLIDDNEYVEALHRLGFDAGQIGRIIATCRRKLIEKQQNAEARRQAAATRATQRTLSNEAKESLRRNAATARGARLRNAQLRAEERTQRRLGAAAVELAQRLGGNPGDYDRGVREWFAMLLEQKHYTREGAASFISSVVADAAVRAGTDWRARGRQLIDLLPQLDLPIAEPPPAPPPAAPPAVEQLPPPASEPPPG